MVTAVIHRPVSVCAITEAIRECVHVEINAEMLDRPAAYTTKVKALCSRPQPVASAPASLCGRLIPPVWTLASTDDVLWDKLVYPFLVERRLFLTQLAFAVQLSRHTPLGSASACATSTRDDL